MHSNSALDNAQKSIAAALVMLEETVAQIDVDSATDLQRNSMLCRCLLRLGQALDSIEMLATRHLYQDMWALCRVLCELATNTCYLQTAHDIEFKRWSNYDLWTDERLISDVGQVVPGFEDMLDARELAQQRGMRRSLEQSGLYSGARQGTWSEKTLEQRTKAVDTVLNLSQGIFQLMYRMTIKVGNSFIHVSPKGVGPQTTPIKAKRDASIEEIHSTAQCLAMTVTAVYAAINFTRVRRGMAEHPLAGRLGTHLRIAFDETIL